MSACSVLDREIVKESCVYRALIVNHYFFVEFGLAQVLTNITVHKSVIVSITAERAYNILHALDLNAKIRRKKLL